MKGLKVNSNSSKLQFYNASILKNIWNDLNIINSTTIYFLFYYQKRIEN